MEILDKHKFKNKDTIKNEISEHINNVSEDIEQNYIEIKNEKDINKYPAPLWHQASQIWVNSSHSMAGVNESTASLIDRHSNMTTNINIMTFDSS